MLEVHSATRHGAEPQGSVGISGLRAEFWTHETLAFAQDDGLLTGLPHSMNTSGFLLSLCAVDTYEEFAQANKELLMSLPPSPVAVEYYRGEDLYM